MEHRTIIDGLGGNKVLADALGVRENAVCHWKVRGIPPFYWQDIVSLAQAAAKDAPTIEMLRSGRKMKHHNPAEA